MAQLKSIAVTPSPYSIFVGQAYQFVALGIYSDGTSADVSGPGTWTSSDPAVATVDSTGVVTGVAAGAADIHCAYSGADGVSAVTVNHALTSLALSPSVASVEVGTTQQFTATATYSDGAITDITDSVSWSSTDARIATVDSSGLVTTVAVGIASIQAVTAAQPTPQGASAPLTVEQPAPAVAPPPDFAALLAIAQRQMILYLSGQAVVSIDNPQLGRVEYNRTNISDLQRLINDLTAVVYPDLALATRRTPISIEAWP